MFWWSHIIQLVVATFYAVKAGDGVPSIAEAVANTKKNAICNDRKVANGTNLAVKTSRQTSISTVLQKG
jgi:hypothetical protein